LSPQEKEVEWKTDYGMAQSTSGLKMRRATERRGKNSNLDRKGSGLLRLGGRITKKEDEERYRPDKRRSDQRLRQYENTNKIIVIKDRGRVVQKEQKKKARGRKNCKPKRDCATLLGSGILTRGNSGGGGGVCSKKNKRASKKFDRRRGRSKVGGGTGFRGIGGGGAEKKKENPREQKREK